MLRFNLGGAAVGMLLLFGAADSAHASESDKAQKAGTVIAAGAAAKTVSVEYVRSTVERLNVRTEPKLSAASIQLIGKDPAFQVLDRQDEWVKIKLASGEGWVFNEYIEYVRTGSADVKPQQAVSKPKPLPEPPTRAKTEGKAVPGASANTSAAPDPPPERQPAQSAVVSIVDITNLRSGPGTDYDIVGKAKPGDTFPIVMAEGDWYRVTRQDGSLAYVASWVVQSDLGAKPPGATVQASAASQADSRVFIYHTHNRESWKNVARQTAGSSIDDPETNISLVGKQLGHLLQQKGVPTLASNDDIAQKLQEQKRSYSESYAESRKSVDVAVKANPSLAYFIDIHRDSDVPRSTTTAAVGGKSYARILFVVGTNHPDYMKNKKLAEALSARLDKKYPGLSRGVLLKGAKEGNGEYNQSVSPGSLLLEVGGANNTLQESLLAADAFADVFADYLQSTP
ncbi:hypothetical protein PAESOLCIP111_03790 [Paenibacillus solanacearum]|uniref:SH3b domain-containing protein n=1 Tax=Paenibacillus solanacearum TaxID=2048548 RepID=A0A916K358_9BACL|nr:stage II sporulation protein P [Paenibacillus solanacearum]CAG7636850.1 hypothetical protein PAESOLCIP111_03790 [Paenibacillus solanacearum]